MGSKRYPETSYHSYDITQRHKPEQLQHQLHIYSHNVPGKFFRSNTSTRTSTVCKMKHRNSLFVVEMLVPRNGRPVTVPTIQQYLKRPSHCGRFRNARCDTSLCGASPHFAILFVFILKREKKRGICFSLSIHYPPISRTATQHSQSSCLEPKGSQCPSRASTCH
jgi:hypothetical protein